jgi:hypothetical protein
LFAEALSALQQVGWSVVSERSAGPLLMPAQLRRYAEAPSVFLECLATLSVCHNRSKTAWLYTRADYAREDERSIRWDECERLSLNSAETNDQRMQISAFWDAHLPFAMACHSDYEYLAIDLRPGNSFGSVVHGLGPEFEETSVLFSNVESFLLGLIDQARQPQRRQSLWPFLFGDLEGPHWYPRGARS